MKMGSLVYASGSTQVVHQEPECFETKDKVLFFFSRTDIKYNLAFLVSNLETAKPLKKTK